VVDTAGDGGTFALTEVNGETPAGAGYNDALAEVFLGLPAVRAFARRWHLFPLYARHGVTEALLGAWRRWARASGRAAAGARPRVAILDWDDVPTRAEFVLFQEHFASMGLEAVIADPRACEYRDGALFLQGAAVDVIYKRVLLAELVERAGVECDVLRAWRDGAVCMVNPPDGKILHKKASLAVLGDERNAHLFDAEDRATIAECVPWTRVVEERRTVFDGREVDLVPHVAAHRERFVLKPNDEYGGTGIVLGWTVDAAEWEAGRGAGARRAVRGAGAGAHPVRALPELRRRPRPPRRPDDRHGAVRDRRAGGRRAAHAAVDGRAAQRHGRGRVAGAQLRRRPAVARAGATRVGPGGGRSGGPPWRAGRRPVTVRVAHALRRRDRRPRSRRPPPSRAPSARGSHEAAFPHARGRRGVPDRRPEDPRPQELHRTHHGAGAPGRRRHEARAPPVHRRGGHAPVRHARRAARRAHAPARRRDGVRGRGGAHDRLGRSHPFSTWWEQDITPLERYEGVRRDMGDLAQRLLIFGMHVHVGIEDKEFAIDALNVARYFLPHLLALTTSSPFWIGRNTGLKSYRSTVFRGFPRTGIPTRLSGWAEYQEYLDTLTHVGSIPDGSKIWWDARPHHKYPTLEFRLCDACTRVEEAVCVAAIIQALVFKLWKMRLDNFTFRDYSSRLIDENKWRAMRFGLSAT
jgi:YbdK family carboxylate-amine ligase